MNTYQKFYAKYYEDIKADSLTFTDNDSNGVFYYWELSREALSGGANEKRIDSIVHHFFTSK